MSDVPGLLQDPNKPDSIISRLKTGEVDGLKQRGIVDKGMIPKVDSAVACHQGGRGESLVRGWPCAPLRPAGDLHR